MQQHRQLSCGGNDRPLLAVSSTTLDTEWAQNVLRALHQQGAQIRIAFLADVHLGSLCPDFLRPGCSPR